MTIDDLVGEAEFPPILFVPTNDYEEPEDDQDDYDDEEPEFSGWAEGDM
jgi:hypothetical protein